MGWAYGIDLRQRVVDAIKDGLIPTALRFESAGIPKSVNRH